MEHKLVANKGVIVNPEGKILLVRDAWKHDHTHAQGRLDFPGGRMDHNETPQEGLLRELKEEIGVEADQVTIERPIHVGRWGVGGDVINKPIIGIFYLVRPVGELEITLSEEHTEYMWIDPHEPYTDDMPAGVRTVMDAYRTQMGMI